MIYDYSGLSSYSRGLVSAGRRCASEQTKPNPKFYTWFEYDKDYITFYYLRNKKEVYEN